MLNEIESSMSARVCMCCGQPLSKKGDLLSRNPNICPSCSSLLDGMEEAAERETRVNTEVTRPPSSKPNSDRKAA